MKLALFAAAAIAAPLLLLRGRAIVRYFAVAAGLWMLLGFLSVARRPLHVDVDPYLAVVTCGVLNAAALWAFVAASRPSDVRWSATRAAVAAALFYIAIVPLQLRTPPDGDESYYILITESLVRDRDVDLANQYRDLEHSVTRRLDLRPQFGDPVGPHGEQYSRHEPFLPLLMIPGYLLCGLPGMVATIALFAALLARSTVRLFEEDGIDDATTRALFPLIAFGPPIVFYAARVWPEVPAAFFLVETVRGIRARRPMRWILAMFGLVLLKLRFLLIAIALLARAARRAKLLAVAAVVVAVPMAIVWFISGSAMNVHVMSELLLMRDLAAMVRGLFGLILDGSQGIAFQAPIYLFGVIALARWRSMPSAFRLGMSSAVVYLITLVPRAEWHGGWSPPLRYVVVFMPFLALGAAALWQRIAAGPIAVATAWTVALVAHGMAYPYRLFHIENGENLVGEALSSIWHTDFSRLFPSYIRVNTAAYVGAAVLLVILLLFRNGRLMSPLFIAVVLSGAFVAGRRPGSRIEFEDAHVIHAGGELYPQLYQVGRFAFRGGWIVRAGDSMSFLTRRGTSVLQYESAGGSVIQLGSRAYTLQPTGGRYGSAEVDIDRDGRVELRCLSGAVNLDRMDHE